MTVVTVHGSSDDAMRLRTTQGHDTRVRACRSRRTRRRSQRMLVHGPAYEASLVGGAEQDVVDGGDECVPQRAQAILFVQGARGRRMMGLSQGRTGVACETLDCEVLIGER